MNNKFKDIVDRNLPVPRNAATSLSDLLNKQEKLIIRFPRFPKKITIALAGLLFLTITVSAYAIGKTILERRLEIEKEKGPMRSWSIEDKASFSEDIQEEIWQEPRYHLPGENEISIDAARNIALSAILEKYHITEDKIVNWEYQESLEYYDADFPEDGSFYNFTWINNTEDSMNLGGDIYVVLINPVSGEIISIESNEDLVG